MNSGGNQMEEEAKLKVTIEADASNTEAEANKAISAMQKVKDAFKSISNKLKISAGNAIQDLVKSMNKSAADAMGDSDEALVEQLRKQVEDLKKELEDAGNSSEGVEKGLKKALVAMKALNGVIQVISRGMRYYLNQNDELKAKLNGCYYALGSLFAPVLEYVIKLFSYLLAIINALARGLGFAGINMKGFGKATGAAAKQMKQLAGFDEINNLSKESGGGAGGAGIADPLAGIDKNAKWLLWIEEHAKGILNTFVLIAATVASLLPNTFISKLIGIGITVKGIWDIVEAIRDITTNGFNLNNVSKLLQGIGETIVGLSVLSGNWIGVLIGGIALVASYFVKHWEDIKTKAVEIWDKIKETFNAMVGGLKTGFSNFIHNLGTTFTNGWNKIISIFKPGGGGFEGMKEGIANTLKYYVNRLISGVNSVIRVPFSGIQNMLSRLRSWSIAGMTPFRNLPWISIPQIPLLAKGGFPEDGLFFANHGELVGKFANGNTAVANNEQIVESFKRGVKEAFSEIDLGNNDTPINVTLSIDGKLLARQMIKDMNEISRVEGVKLLG